MPYVVHTHDQIQSIFKELGISSFADLYRHLPGQVKLKKDLAIPSGISELELKKYISALADKNQNLTQFNSFLGAGIYDHYIPAAVNHLLSRSEFYTSYTPYQAECSQGVLQAIYEYQTYMCILTGMDVTNASLYDGATAVSEAVLMSMRLSRRTNALVARSVHPEYRSTLSTYTSAKAFGVKEVGLDKGLLDIDELASALNETISCLVVQSPNFFGLIEDFAKISERIKKHNIHLIMVTNPMTLALLKEPVRLGVDIVCGDGQVFGTPASFGGPTFGFLATHKGYVRQLPGRVVGKTVDAQGECAYCLTLQTREQHIRREKATSNICSNQSLNALGAAVYLSLVGKEGLKQAALYSLNLSHYLHEELQKVRGVTFPFENRFFNEFVWRIDNAHSVVKELEKKGILAGIGLDTWYSDMENCILSACTEKKTKEDIDQFVRALQALIT